MSRLYGKAGWQTKRQMQLKREPLCRYCKEQGRITAATVADHITPHKGNAEAFWNNELQSLCKHCHDSIKQRQEHGKEMAVVGIDGWNIGK